MKFYIYNLGCKVNSYESNIMKEDLEKNGYVKGLEDNSDIYIINTCTVTNTSDNKSLKTIRKVIRNHKDKIVIACGCMTQVNSLYLKDLNVSIIIGNKGKSKITNYIKQYIKDKKQIIDVTDFKDDKFEDMCLNNFDKTRAFVKIEDGCENFCSYCIIPYARGKIRSKDPDLVIYEVNNLIKEGHKEIVLTGIHTGHYGADINYDFAKLLNRLVQIKGLERLRISSIEITEITDDVLDVLKNNSNLVSHLHIPLQSGSDTILKLMNRKYDKEYFINKINKIREIRPDISITTDVIVGFPSETEKLYEESLDTIRRIGFSKVHVFPFSLRKGTKAEDIKDHVDDVTKKERVRKLVDLSNKLENEYMNKFIDKTVILLPEVYKTGYLIGHTDNYLKVRIKGSKELLNQLVSVKIISNNYPYLDGELLQECVLN